MFQPAELRKLLDAALAILKAMIYLGANCALLPVDLARLELEEIGADFQWLRQARHKTGVDRLAALWPETAEALKAAIAQRTRAREPPSSPVWSSSLSPGYPWFGPGRQPKRRRTGNPRCRQRS